MKHWKGDCASVPCLVLPTLPFLFYLFATEHRAHAPTRKDPWRLCASSVHRWRHQASTDRTNHGPGGVSCVTLDSFFSPKAFPEREHLVCQSNFELNFGILWIRFAVSSGELAPVFQPIRCKTGTKCDLIFLDFLSTLIGSLPWVLFCYLWISTLFGSFVLITNLFFFTCMLWFHNPLNVPLLCFLFRFKTCLEVNFNASR